MFQLRQYLKWASTVENCKWHFGNLLLSLGSLHKIKTRGPRACARCAAHDLFYFINQPQKDPKATNTVGYRKIQHIHSTYKYEKNDKNDIKVKKTIQSKYSPIQQYNLNKKIRKLDGQFKL